MPPRRITVFALLAVLLAGLAVAAYWHWSAERLARQIVLWSEQQRAAGYEVSYAGPEIGGFPLELVARFQEPSIASPQGWRWQGPPLTGRAWLWNPFTIRVEASGRHRVVRREGEPPSELAAEHALAVIHLRGDGRIDRASAETAALRIDNAQEKLSVERSAWSLGPVTPGSQSGPQELALSGEVHGLSLPEDKAGPLGPTLRHLSIEGALVGEIPPGARHQLIKQWRDAGGLLRFGRVRLAWGPLELEGDGSLGLDRQFRPLGAFTARTRGLLQTLDILSAKGVLKRGQVIPAKIALLALGGGKDENGKAVIVLPITLQDGLLYLGPQPLMELFPLL